jgi:hypothetical protein
MVSWRIELRGGAFDGWGGTIECDPEPAIVAWRCDSCEGCSGHASFDVFSPAIVLRTAEAYRRSEVDSEAWVAVYDVGDGAPRPGVEERELVGIGAPVHANCRTALL